VHFFIPPRLSSLLTAIIEPHLWRQRPAGDTKSFSQLKNNLSLDGERHEKNGGERFGNFSPP
jgi:hypothetical protein